MKICLIGSTKFKDEFQEANKDLTLKGHVVYSVAFFGHADNVQYTEDEKIMLDAVHLRKILESDAVVHIHPDYTGESTKKELAFCHVMDKPIYILDENGTFVHKKFIGSGMTWVSTLR